MKEEGAGLGAAWVDDVVGKTFLAQLGRHKESVGTELLVGTVGIRGSQYVVGTCCPDVIQIGRGVAGAGRQCRARR